MKSTKKSPDLEGKSQPTIGDRRKERKGEAAAAKKAYTY